MPEYDYECGQCNHSFSIVQSIKDDELKRCPECNKNHLQRVILSPPLVFIKGEPTTIGQLADRNTQKMGRYELENKRNKDDMATHRKNKEVRDKRRKINKMTPEQKRKWIREGD